MKNVCCNCAISGLSPVCEISESCPFCGEVATVVIAGRGFCESVQHFSDRAYEAMQAVKAAQAPVVEVKPAKVRCAHYATIKAFFAAAKERDFDTVTESGKNRCRGALSVYLGRRIQSRADLTKNDWENGITGVKAGVLFW